MTAAPASAIPCPGDLNGDQQVDSTDMALRLFNFEIPSGAKLDDGDLDTDSGVEFDDLSTLISCFGAICS